MRVRLIGFLAALLLGGALSAPPSWAGAPACGAHASHAYCNYGRHGSSYDEGPTRRPVKVIPWGFSPPIPVIPWGFPNTRPARHRPAPTMSWGFGGGR